MAKLTTSDYNYKFCEFTLGGNSPTTMRGKKSFSLLTPDVGGLPAASAGSVPASVR